MIDSHCHLDFAEFDSDRESVITAAIEAGVTEIIMPGVTRERWPFLTALAEKHDCLRYALGLHPYFLEGHHDKDVAALEKLLEESAAVAVGEIGLDFFRRDLNPERQVELFQAQLGIAKNFDLPVILHVRKAHDQVIRMVSAAGVKGGIVHAFNGSLQQAAKYRSMGFCFGFGGMASFDHSSRLHQLVRSLPLDSMVLETDAPDMAGIGHRGKRNSPAYLPEYLAVLSRLRDMAASELAEITAQNTRTCLCLD